MRHSVSILSRRLPTHTPPCPEAVTTSKNTQSHCAPSHGLSKGVCIHVFCLSEPQWRKRTHTHKTHTPMRSCPGRSNNEEDVLTLDLKLQVTKVKLERECGPSGRFEGCESVWILKIKRLLPPPLGRTRRRRVNCPSAVEFTQVLLFSTQLSESWKPLGHFRAWD